MGLAYRCRSGRCRGCTGGTSLDCETNQIQTFLDDATLDDACSLVAFTLSLLTCFLPEQFLSHHIFHIMFVHSFSFSFPFFSFVTFHVTSLRSQSLLHVSRSRISTRSLSPYPSMTIYFHSNEHACNLNSLICSASCLSAAKGKRVQPSWSRPDGTELPSLRLYNSLTRTKVHVTHVIDQNGHM